MIFLALIRAEPSPSFIIHILEFFMRHAQAESMEPLATRLVLASDPIQFFLLPPCYKPAFACLAHFFVFVISLLNLHWRINILAHAAWEWAYFTLLFVCERSLRGLNWVHRLRLVEITHVFWLILVLSLPGRLTIGLELKSRRFLGNSGWLDARGPLLKLLLGGVTSSFHHGLALLNLQILIPLIALDLLFILLIILDRWCPLLNCRSPGCTLAALIHCLTCCDISPVVVSLGLTLLLIVIYLAGLPCALNLVLGSVSICIKSIRFLEFEQSLSSVSRHFSFHSKQIIFVTLHLVQVLVNHFDEVLLACQLLLNQLVLLIYIFIAIPLRLFELLV